METPIEIITCTMGGRDSYLFECLSSVYKACLYSTNIRQHLILQGCKLSDHIAKVVYSLSRQPNYTLNVIELKENIGIAHALNHVSSIIDNGSLIFKMDDDCKILSERFFVYAREIHKRFPSAVFSPYPVGLIRSPGGPPGSRHAVYKNKKTDTVFTLRVVNHVGGFARFAPSNLFYRDINPTGFKFTNDLINGISGNEDGQLSEYCNRNKIPMFYLENAMVVEHNESTYGQVIRYPSYFENRSWESNLIGNLNVIED